MGISAYSIIEQGFKMSDNKKPDPLNKYQLELPPHLIEFLYLSLYSYFLLKCDTKSIQIAEYSIQQSSFSRDRKVKLLQHSETNVDQILEAV